MIEATGPQQTRISTFKQIKPKTVVVPDAAASVVASEPYGPLPLVLQPSAANVDLADWAASHEDYLASKLLQHGGILFRGFGIDGPERFQRFVERICPNLFTDNGEHDRASVGGKVYTPTFYPNTKKVLWHNENSFNQAWPRLIWFCCTTPAQTGGETPIVDSRRFFTSLDPALRALFVEKQVPYVRTYGSGLGLSWETVFRTSSRADVERACEANRMTFEWLPDGRLVTSCTRPAAVTHPITGEIVWFNQAQHWHPHCLDPDVRAGLAAVFPEHELPRNCCFGDGSPIADSMMDEICALYDRLEVRYAWQRGDVVMLDNLLSAHARNPFTGERKLLVALGDMRSYDDVSGVR